jgi:tetratricopeptide (TPR) repeat protein
MQMPIRHLILPLLLGAALPCPALAQDAAPPPPASEAAGDHGGGDHNHGDMIMPREATLLPGYGVGGFTVTTSVPQAQAFFSNGMELGAAFAHTAAGEAMEEGVRLDPACAMCRWGEALVKGPTINFGKDKAERKPLAALVKSARKLAKKNGTPRERELIAALDKRYHGDPGKADRAYALAMRDLAAKYPDDNEIAVFAADGLMVASFQYEGEGYDKALMADAERLLETVLARAPDHTPAIHFYIHAEEVLEANAKAEPYANKLAQLAPNASHLVHMPSHTWYWLGRYEDAAQTNRAAVEIGKANARRLGLPDPTGVWDLPYHAHNVIFGLGGALMAGNADIALELGRPLAERAGTDEEGGPIRQLLASAGYWAMGRFASDAEVMALPEPKLPYYHAAWRYARGEVLARKGDVAGVKAELAAIPETLVTGTPDRGHQAPEQMLGIVRAVLAGRIAMLEGRPADAAKDFARGADIEETKDFSLFSDPPAFWYPVRRDEAAALLAAGNRDGARRAVEASLKLRPQDPVALEIQGKLN